MGFGYEGWANPQAQPVRLPLSDGQEFQHVAQVLAKSYVAQIELVNASCGNVVEFDFLPERHRAEDS